MELIRRTTWALSAALSIATVMVVLITAHAPRQEGLLRDLTRENGVVEWASVVILVVIALVAGRALLLDRKQPALPAGGRGILIALVFLATLAALEEISWGQQVFGFRSNKFFLDHNLQRETFHLLIRDQYGDLCLLSLDSMRFSDGTELSAGNRDSLP